MPDKIFIEKYPNEWVMYYLDNTGYYHSDDAADFLTGGWITLYPDGHLTYLWNGIERKWNRKWRTA